MIDGDLGARAALGRAPRCSGQGSALVSPDLRGGLGRAPRWSRQTSAVVWAGLRAGLGRAPRWSVDQQRVVGELPVRRVLSFAALA